MPVRVYEEAAYYCVYCWVRIWGTHTNRSSS